MNTFITTQNNRL